MARLMLKLRRYVRRRPLRFLFFVLLYLSAGGSLVFLRSGETVVGHQWPGAEEGRVAPEGQGFGLISQVFREGWRPPQRYDPPWLKQKSQELSKRGREGDRAVGWSRALKGRSSKDSEEGRATYLGCYADDTHKRALRGASFFDYKKMTVFRCQDNCAERGYLYAGLEFGAECYCGHKVQAANASESECNMDCKGERGSTCGGANRLSVYRLELSQESARRYGSAIFKGCFRKPENINLTLPIGATISNMSIDKCVDFCTEKEFPLAVLANPWCRCGFPTVAFPLHEREDEDLCQQHCPGDDSESCGTEEYFLVYQTQVQDKRCMDRHFLLSRGKQLTALASFPGAGNTWARHLIELATGIYTGSYYFDGSLYNKGFKGERDHWRSGRTICIKTHESGKKEIEAFDSAILMIRNPFKALMAEFNRKYGGHVGFASQTHWKGKDWPEFVKNYAPWWASHTLDWLKFGKRVHVVHFEELKKDLFTQLRNMVLFLGLGVSEDRLLCVEGQKDGNFKRSGLRKLEYDPYTLEMRANIDGLIRVVDRALRDRQLPGIPEEYRPR
ncbi:WSC domain-containing protein 2-like [Scleropages formosus]|nr:WSC domain-containing protein 2-like [Scleropages formosus]XP_018610043.1 WSC domain-containing protein 2-like [Scleropages formosus]XP_029108726.1 WSC domain-containing protein 2-like [Scleropages formosus]